jgi:hypothetical protein
MADHHFLDLKHEVGKFRDFPAGDVKGFTRRFSRFTYILLLFRA